MKKDDLLIMISDYGNDFVYLGFNYICEMLFLIIYLKMFKELRVLNDFIGLGIIGNIVVCNFGVEIVLLIGEDIFDKLV